MLPGLGYCLHWPGPLSGHGPASIHDKPLSKKGVLRSGVWGPAIFFAVSQQSLQSAATSG